MDRKLRDYFDAGVDLVWYAEPKKRVVSVHEAVYRVRKLDQSATLDGGAVLPGLAIRVGEWLRQAMALARNPRRCSDTDETTPPSRVGGIVGVR